MTITGASRGLTQSNIGATTSPQRAAIYLRVSTGRQAEHDLSIPDQRAQTSGWIAARGWKLAAEYVEPVCGGQRSMGGPPGRIFQHSKVAPHASANASLLAAGACSSHHRARPK